MGLTSLSIVGYRSIRSIAFPLRRLTVLVGGNGIGKTNLYRSLELLQAAALGTLAREIAREGGLASIHFAGELRKHEQPRLRLEASMDGILESTGELNYAVEARFPAVGSASFPNEVQIREERLTLLDGRKPVELMHRDGPAVWARDDEGVRRLVDEQLLASETALASLGSAHRVIDAAPLRHFRLALLPFLPHRRGLAAAQTKPRLHRTDIGFERRQSCGSVRHASARARRKRRSRRRDRACLSRSAAERPPPRGNGLVLREFSGSTETPVRRARTVRWHLAVPGPGWRAACLPSAAIRSLNEPETSLHPMLLPALARMIVNAAERTQIWVVTHSRELADAIAEESGVMSREVIRRDGATWLNGLTQFAGFDD